MIDQIKEAFASRYQTTPVLFRSPGRVNLIGEHTDYNDGFVLPAAINKELFFAIAPNKINRCRVFAYDLNEEIDIPMSDIKPSEKGWANYVLGVVDQLYKKGLEIGGFDCVFGGNIPRGAGMSSSAALECGTGIALNALFQLGLGKQTIATIGQHAEHEFVGVNCGIMDQFANVFGRANHVIKLDCRSLEYEYFPLDIAGYKIVLMNSNVSHSLASSEYNVRRQQCEAGVAFLQKKGMEISSLRDVSLEEIIQHQSEMDSVVFQRCHYVIEENRRVEEACHYLQQNDLISFGKKMYESHEGLSSQYEVSCKELDFLVEQTRQHPQVLGARMMGGGFGGCTINLIEESAVDTLTEQMAEAYHQKFGLKTEVYVGDIVKGTSVL